LRQPRAGSSTWAPWIASGSLPRRWRARRREDTGYQATDARRDRVKKSLDCLRNKPARPATAAPVFRLSLFARHWRSSYSRNRKSAARIHRMQPDDAFETWAAKAVARRWPRARCDKITALRGDLSTRRFWRVAIAQHKEIIAPHGETGAPRTAILVDLGPDDFPSYVRVLNLLPRRRTAPPWIDVHRALESIGAPVPELYDADLAQRAMLVEDVGELSLLDAVRRPGADAADLFRLAASELIRLHVDGTGQIDRRCVAREIAYSGRLFEWELKEFAEVGLAAVASGADFSPIAPELKRLAARLDRFPRVFSHRDYHGHNLFIQDGPRIRIL